MTRLHLLAAAAGLLLATSARGAPPADVAGVFPPTTLAYAELHAPAELGPQLAAAIKGTALADGIPLVHAKKDAAKTMPGLLAGADLGRLALLASPELAAEFGKLGGVAVGLVGFAEGGQPEVAVAVLTGDSAAAGLAARAFLTTSPDLRRVGAVGAVPVFQHRQPAVAGYEPNGVPKLSDEKPKEGAYEPTYAYTPGLFVAGTSKAALEPVLKRFRGDEADSLLGAAGFKAAAAEFRKPGLFFYADAAALLARADATKRRGPGADLVAWLKLVANAKALKAVAGRVGFRDGGLHAAVALRFDPAAKSPLADALGGPAVAIEALHHARKPAAFAAALNLPAKGRGPAVLNLLDALAKGGGELGRLPSDVAKELADKHKVSADDLLAKVRTVTVVVPARQELPKGGRPIPMFVFHAEDADAAAALEEFVPKLVAEVAGEAAPAQPAAETVGGVKVRSLAGTGLPWKAAVHYARKDAVLAWGLDRKLVAAALTADPAASAVGAKGPAFPAGSALAGVLNLGDLFTAFEEPPAAEGAVRLLPLGTPMYSNGPVAPEWLRKAVDKARVAFLASFGALPPAAVSARRDGARVVFEAFQPGVQGGGLKPVVAAGLEWFDQRLNPRDPNRPAPPGMFPGSFPR